MQRKMSWRLRRHQRSFICSSSALCTDRFGADVHHRPSHILGAKYGVAFLRFTSLRWQERQVLAQERKISSNRKFLGRISHGHPSTGRIHCLMWSFPAKIRPKNAKCSYITWRPSAFKTTTLASHDVISYGQICGSKLQRVFTLGGGCWLPNPGVIQADVQEQKIGQKQACLCGHPWPKGADVYGPRGSKKTFLSEQFSLMLIFRSLVLRAIATKMPKDTVRV